jgi:NAD-dependent SIR2 family protein deacetylase
MLLQQQDVREATGRAARYVRNADVLLIAAGAGMSVDAGRLDYYDGIQLSHPRLTEIELSVYDLFNHGLFEHNPALAWGHWITRQREYMNTLPHIGYDILYAWSKCGKSNVRVITTNLDRHFVRISFTPNNVFEMHGSMYDAQCMNGGRAAHIRINLHQAHIDVHENNISLPLGALEALRIMD